MRRKRTGKLLQYVVIAEMYGLHVRIDKVRLVSEGLLEQCLDDVEIDSQQRRKRAHVSDVLHEDAGAGAFKILVAHPGQRNADDRDVVTIQETAARPGRVIDQAAARLDFGHVTRIRLCVHRHHIVDAVRAATVAVTRDANFVPRWQALDI